MPRDDFMWLVACIALADDFQLYDYFASLSAMNICCSHLFNEPDVLLIELKVLICLVNTWATRQHAGRRTWIWPSLLLSKPALEFQLPLIVVGLVSVDLAKLVQLAVGLDDTRMIAALVWVEADRAFFTSGVGAAGGNAAVLLHCFPGESAEFAHELQLKNAAMARAAKR
jgi:hypothetical protein